MDSGFIEMKITYYLWIIFGGFLIVFGTAGNILSLLVLNRERDAKSSTYILLSALAICDLSTLIFGLGRHLLREIFEIEIRVIHNSICKLHLYIIYVLIPVATWILVIVTMERALSVWKPLIVKKICNIRSSYIVLVITIMSVVFLNCHILVYSGLVIEPINYNSTEFEVGYYCSFYSKVDETYLYFLVNIWPYVEACYKFIIPFVILLVCNVIIITAIRRSLRFQQNSNATAGRNASQTRLNVMIVFLSMSFFILVAPLNTFIAIGFYFHPRELNYSDVYMKAEYDMVLVIMTLLYYSNNAINFLLYVLWGDKFRQHTKHILCCCCKYVRRQRV
ncbi:hypothetical protein ACF0H5_020603 [Mactra antiquata]